jgi:hypothetical protein
MLLFCRKHLRSILKQQRSRKIAQSMPPNARSFPLEAPTIEEQGTIIASQGGNDRGRKHNQYLPKLDRSLSKHQQLRRKARSMPLIAQTQLLSLTIT